MVEHGTEKLEGRDNNNNNWEVRDLRGNSSNSSEEAMESVHPSRGDIGMEESTYNDEVLGVDIETTVGIQDKLLKLKLGRGRGRPRKLSRITNFFDFALKKRRNEGTFRLRMDTANKKSGSRKRVNRPTAGACINAFQGRGTTQEISDETQYKSDLATQILETSQTLGLTLTRNKEDAIKLIKENLTMIEQDQEEIFNDP